MTLPGSVTQAESLAVNDDQKKAAQAYHAFAEGDEKPPYIYEQAAWG
ncbi:MAG: hypothetical protein ACM3Q2_14320 [Syntrophothermus sp.]